MSHSSATSRGWKDPPSHLEGGPDVEPSARGDQSIGRGRKSLPGSSSQGDPPSGQGDYRLLLLVVAGLGAGERDAGSGRVLEHVAALLVGPQDQDSIPQCTELVQRCAISAWSARYPRQTSRCALLSSTLQG
ncbi:unnamed protein product [Linum trigynum]|uniref:Uncharacterized protein n=1 Tax=Linum trigynum TaxID=586398 RepID=A0AAV2GR70_9ROSI